MRTSLLRPLLLVLGIASLLCAAAVFIAGYLSLAKIRLGAEVYAHELIGAGAVDTAAVKAVLDEEGLPFDPDAGKETGLGAYIVREADLRTTGTVLNVACGLLILNGIVLGVAAFGKPPGQSAL